MKHYINNTTKEVFGYETDGSQDEYIKEGLVPITDTALATLRKQQEQARLDALTYKENRAIEYPNVQDFMEAYTEKEIGGSSTKWNAYVTAYNKVRSDNPKPE